MELGQYFTKNLILLSKIDEFIRNNPKVILEPSVGICSIVDYIIKKRKVDFDMYEIDKKLKIPDKYKNDIIYKDFLKSRITKLYKTIIGNPPYIKTKNGNIYIKFIEKCYELLDNDGELIFVIPSDFFKLTSSVKILNKMFENGYFTDIYHPHDENLFENAKVDVLIFRYVKDKNKNMMINKIKYNNDEKFMINNNGLVLFENNMNNEENIQFKQIFDIYVGCVSGCDKVFKNKEYGNIDILINENVYEKFILIDKFPTTNIKMNDYLYNQKQVLLNRRIKKFNENNWFEWGALRNINNIKKHLDTECIYIKNLTRNKNIAFVGKVGYFGGNLIILIPKQKMNLKKIVEFLNTDRFKFNFLYSGRFKIGHRQISNSELPKKLINNE